MSTNVGLQVNAVRSARSNAFNTSVRVLTLLLLFSTAAVYEAVHLSSLADADIWWHLQTGLWILENHALPHSGVFSQCLAAPWTASSWGYEVLLAAAYKWIGLKAVPALLMALKIALAVSAFRLARGSRQNFWLAVSLVIAVQCSLLDLRPLPNLCSFVLFAIEVALLFQSRRTASLRPLFWLPLLFVFWTNLHLQFAYGLLVLGLFFAAALTEEICRRYGSTWFGDGQIPPIGVIGAVTAVSGFATLLSPYSYHIYGAVAKNISPVAYIADDHAMNFRHPQDYVLLLLAMAAFLALGRRRSHDLFKIALMIASSALAFGVKGDAGFLALAAAAVISEAYSIEKSETEQEIGHGPAHWEKLAIAGLLLIVYVAAVELIPSSGNLLLNKIAKSFPVRASDYIRENRLPSPLFNEYQWGGFLTWYLPQYPVAIDGRRDLYGDEANLVYFQVTSAEVPLNSDPAFAGAQTYLLPANSPMAEGLATIPDFTMVYRDDLAMVLVRKN